MTQEELEQIEISNVAATEAVEKGEALKRLMANEDYKLIIQDNYLRDYPSEIGVAIATNTGAYDKDKLLDLLTGINSFIQFTFRISKGYEAALQTLRDNEEYVANSVGDTDE